MVGTRSKGVNNLSYNGNHISSVSANSKGNQKNEADGTGSTNPAWKKVLTGGKKGKGRPSSCSSLSKSDMNPFEFLAEDDSSPCKMCDQMVTLQQKGIQCTVCKFWVHLHCSNITTAQYAFLETDTDDVFDWSCKKCKALKLSLPNADEKVAEHESRLDSLQELIKVVMQQNNLILQLLQNENRLEDRIKAHVTEALDAQKQKTERKDNLIIFNVPECDSESKQAIIDHDCSELDAILKVVDPEYDYNQSIARNGVMRLGTMRKASTSNPNPKPRPIRVQFSDGDVRKNILNNARKLAGSKFSKIGISADKTWYERQAELALRKELKERKGNGENVVIFRGKVMSQEDKNMLLFRPNEEFENDNINEGGATGMEQGSNRH